MNFPNRGPVDIPNEKMDLVAGFSHEAINYMLGGSFRGSYVPLNDNIINGRIKGVAGVVGCSNPKVVPRPVPRQPGGGAHRQRYPGRPDRLLGHRLRQGRVSRHPNRPRNMPARGWRKSAGPWGCRPSSIQAPVWTTAASSSALSEMVKVGGLGKDISDLPVAGAAPEWMSEKAIAIGQYFVASGVFTVFGDRAPRHAGAPFSAHHIFRRVRRTFSAGCGRPSRIPGKMAGMIIDHINQKREKLGIGKGKERVLFDMEMRRDRDLESLRRAMSKIIATRAIRGAHKLVARAEKELTELWKKKVPRPRSNSPIPATTSRFPMGCWG